MFDDRSIITFDHLQDCCEDNYADFQQLEDLALIYDFDTANLKFDPVTGSGFRFGNDYMFFIPCYSAQNGYYTTELDIYYNGVKVLNTKCEVNLV